MSRRAAVGSLLLAVAVVLLGSVGTALAQGPIPGAPDLHLETGWKFWFVTEDIPNSDGVGHNRRIGDGFLSGPTFSLHVDPKWTFQMTYLDTEMGRGLEELRPKLGQQFRTKRSDTDLNLQYHIVPWLTVFADYKRVDRRFGTGSNINAAHNTQQGIGFGLSGGGAVWSPTETSALHLSGAVAWLPIAFNNTPGEDQSNRWFNVEGGIGYTQVFAPISVTAVLGYRWQQVSLFTSTTATGGKDRLFEVDSFGPTLSLSVRW